MQIDNTTQESPELIMKKMTMQQVARLFLDIFVRSLCCERTNIRGREKSAQSRASLLPKLGRHGKSATHTKDRAAMCVQSTMITLVFASINAKNHAMWATQRRKNWNRMTCSSLAKKQDRGAQSQRNNIPRVCVKKGCRRPPQRLR